MKRTPRDTHETVVDDRAFLDKLIPQQKAFAQELYALLERWNDVPQGVVLLPIEMFLIIAVAETAESRADIERYLQLFREALCTRWLENEAAGNVQ